MLKFISLLGTSPYIPCSYYLDGQVAGENSYIQKALIEILIEEGMVPDGITIFTTDSAYNRNWIKNAYDDSQAGLKEELEIISGERGIELGNIMIPEGHNEEELWDIFNIILNELEEDSEIILDITHSFRYLPMLTFIILNYARLVKGCRLRAVYYGAFDVLGPARTVAQLPASERKAPIFELTSFVNLFDWTIAIDRYLATGDASLVEDLTSLEVKRMNRELGKKMGEAGVDPSVLFRDPRVLRNLAESMEEFNNTVLTCRGPEIGKSVSYLKESIDKVVESTAHERIKPLSPIMEMLEERFSNFSYEEDGRNLIETAKWCHDNKMYQQGLTLLEEGIISYVCEKWGLDSLDLNNRKKVTSTAYDVNKGNTQVDYNYLGLSKETGQELYTLLYRIGNMRNDINHAGWRKNPANHTRFSAGLMDFTQGFEAIILGEENLEEEGEERQMLLIFSHKLTEKQREEAVKRYKIGEFIKPDDIILNKWANIPPKLEDLSEYLTQLREWIDAKSNPGDYVLIHGDFGATFTMVNHCLGRGLIPVYATSQRRAVEKRMGETIKISREFEHVSFREYKL